MKKRTTSALLIGILSLALLISGCGGASTQTKESSLLDEDWSQITAQAKGTTVNFYMWGGDSRINNWVDTYVAENMEKQYGIKVKRVPMDAQEFVNKLVSEKQVNREKGSIDLLWVNGENFRALRQADALWGPFVDKLPNYNRYVDKTAPDITSDFGYPVNGYEAPYAKAQFVLAYDAARVQDPPKSAAELLTWAKAHPGRFTYPELPDFTGSVFVRNLMYELCGGYQAFPAVKGTVDKEKLNAQLKPLWDYLNELKPYLWRQGQTYPSTIDEVDKLFADGEIDMTMSYDPTSIAGKVDKGLFPRTVRTYVLDKGTIGNTSFLAIPFNAPNKAAALVLANFLESPQAQISKYDPKNWGCMLGIDVNKMEPQYVTQLQKIDLGAAALSAQELQSHRLPEIDSAYIPVIEDLWQQNVLGKEAK